MSGVRRRVPVFGGLSLLAALPYLAGGLVGGWIGGKLYGRVSVKWLKWLFAGFLFYAGGEVSAVTDWIIPFLCGLGSQYPLGLGWAAARCCFWS